MRRVVVDFCDWADAGTMLGLVIEGWTTPWSWASLPGLGTTEAGVYLAFETGISLTFARSHPKMWLRGQWMKAERRPEGRKP